METSSPEVKALFHASTNTICYIVWCPQTNKCAIIDSVMDFNDNRFRTSSEHVNDVISEVDSRSLEVQYIMETHVHADHFTGAQLLKNHYPNAQTCIGFNVTEVQRTFSQLFNLPNFPCDGSQFDKLWTDGEDFMLGNLNCRAIYTPGHTPACMTYVIGDTLFTGDTVFMPDFGSARCDFPGGSADNLYDSIQKILGFPEEYKVYVGHDYGPGGREIAWETTVAQEKQNNVHVKEGTPKDQFVQWRSSRDGTLNLPRLIMPALQVNLSNGKLPEPESNGVSYLRIPLNTLQ